ncbi:MAG: putative capsid protein [Cressdnaviricota sp.]|nr:MAG: putative capsid protein [Cressdnaviricota sp.]
MPRRRSTARSSARSAKRRPSYSRRPARRRVQAGRTVSRRPIPLGMTSLSKTIRKVPFLMAHVDPFLPVVRGVKVPDTNTMESDTFVCADEYSATITSGTAVKAFAFNPAITSSCVPSVEGAGAWTWPVTYTGGIDVVQLGNIQAASTAYRTVAHGIRISSTLAATAATGFVHVAIYSPATFGEATWPFPTTIGQMRDLPFYRKVTLSSLTQSPLTVVNKFLDQTAFRYYDARETTAGYANSSKNFFQITHSWATIFVAIEGAPAASTCLGIEMILHGEAICKAGSSNSASPAAPGNPGLMAAAGTMAANTPATHFESEQGSVFQQATDAIQEGLSAGAENVAQWGVNQLRHSAENSVYVAGGVALNYLTQRGRPSININGQTRLTN